MLLYIVKSLGNNTAMTSPEQSIGSGPHVPPVQEEQPHERGPEQATAYEGVAEDIRSAEQAQEKAEVVADQVAAEVRETPGRLQDYLNSIFSFLSTEGGRKQFVQVAEGVARSVEQRMWTIDGAGIRLHEADRAFYAGSQHHLDALYGGVRALNSRYGRTPSPHDAFLELMRRSAEAGDIYGRHLEGPAGSDPDHADRRSFTNMLSALSGAVHDNRDELGRLIRAVSARQQPPGPVSAPPPQPEQPSQPAPEAPAAAGDGEQAVPAESPEARPQEVPAPEAAAPPQAPVPPEQPPFAPSSDWQEIPPGTAVPAGGSFRMGLEEGGKTYGRWADAPPAAPEKPNS